MHDVSGWRLHESLPLKLHYAPGVVPQLVDRVAAAMRRAPRDASVSPSATGLTVTPSHAGRALNEGALKRTLASALVFPSHSADIPATTKPVAPKVSSAQLAPEGARLHHRRPPRPRPALLPAPQAHAQTYPIAVGRQGLETPPGLYDVQWKQTNPSWYVPELGLGRQARRQGHPARARRPDQGALDGLQRRRRHPRHRPERVRLDRPRRLARLRADADPRRHLALRPHAGGHAGLRRLGFAAWARRPATSVAIVGGGIGGIAAAVSLLQAGFDVHVYERAAAVSEVGAGIQVSPNASRVLHRLGLADELARMGVRPLAWHQRRWDDGRTLLRADLGDAVIEAFGFPHYQMHRADLLGTLVGALPPERLHVGHLFTRPGRPRRPRRGDLRERHDDRGRPPRRRRRHPLGRPRGAVRPAGPRLHRLRRLPRAGAGRAPAPPRPRGDCPDLDGPRGPLRPLLRAGGRLVNFVAVIEQDSWTRESWTDPGDPADAIAAFEGWHPAAARDPAARSTRRSSGPCSTARRSPRWSRGRVTLLGDACHPMLPFMAQGAAQALEDGATLTACLAAEPDVAAALRRYEQLRLPRASRIQALSTENKTRFHLPDGERQRERDAPDGGRRDRLRHPGRRVDLRPRRGGGRRVARGRGCAPRSGGAGAGVDELLRLAQLPARRGPVAVPQPAATRAPICSSTRVQ